MTIDEVVEQKVCKILTDGHYCTDKAVQEISSITCKTVRDSLIEHEIKSLQDNVDVQRQCLGKMWDAIDSMNKPKHPKFTQFIHFGWLKFWKWNWSKLAFWRR